MLSTVRAAKPAVGNQPVLVPGDPQRAQERERRRDGIALDERTAEILTALATVHGLPGPASVDTTDEGIAS
jgi:ureidoglycolate dehydrogenase (NAD+)